MRRTRTFNPTFQCEYQFANAQSKDKLVYGGFSIPRRMDCESLVPLVIVMEPLKSKSWLHTIAQLRRNDFCVLQKLEVAEDGTKLVKILKVTRRT